jgi:hypothetical protein
MLLSRYGTSWPLISSQGSWEGELLAQDMQCAVTSLEAYAFGVLANDGGFAGESENQPVC